MKDIILYSKQHSFTYKTNKSIFNLLTGKKTHQTFFDACSQQLLSLYHSLPNLKYPSFERFMAQNVNNGMTIKVHPRYTYDSLVHTFNCIQLLIQTLSNTQQNVYSFIPISQHGLIQRKVKQIYYYIKKEDKDSAFITELNQLFKALYTNNNNYCCLHYYLQGYEEPMYTRQQISLIESIPEQHLFNLEMNELVTLMYELEIEYRYPILSQCIIKPSLLHKTHITQQQLKQRFSMTQIAQKQHVKLNTIEDHILELFIKGYITNYFDFISEDGFHQFNEFYNKHRGERLKAYKQAFPNLSYFEIKLMIVGIERGELIARG